MPRPTIDSQVFDTYLCEGRNCAEALLLGASRALSLPCTPEMLRAVGIFGGGLGCGETCGALLGALSAVGLLTIDERGAHACPEAKLAAAKLTERFLAHLGSLRCDELKPRYCTEERRCAYIVSLTAMLLEQVCTDLPPR